MSIYTRIANLEKRLDELESKYDRLERQVDFIVGFYSKEGNLKRGVKVLEDKISFLSLIRPVFTRVSNLEKRLEELETKYDRLERQVNFIIGNFTLLGPIEYGVYS